MKKRNLKASLGRGRWSELIGDVRDRRVHWREVSNVGF